MKTVLIFVLSCRTPPYGQLMDFSMATWDSEDLEGTRTIYYHGMPMIVPTARVVSFPIDEDYRTITAKNMMAFRWALNLPWDYMARVNASCYVHKERLLQEVQALPSTGVMRGIASESTPVCGVPRRWMWGGGQFILSRDVVRAIVDNEARANHNVMEDVALGELVQELGITIDTGGKSCSINLNADGTWTVIAYNGQPGFTFRDFSEVSRITDQFFFRVKHDPNRLVDFEVMKLLKQHLR